MSIYRHGYLEHETDGWGARTAKGLLVEWLLPADGRWRNAAERRAALEEAVIAEVKGQLDEDRFAPDSTYAIAGPRSQPYSLSNLICDLDLVEYVNSLVADHVEG